MQRWQSAPKKKDWPSQMLDIRDGPGGSRSLDSRRKAPVAGRTRLTALSRTEGDRAGSRFGLLG
jgi:hypothetical protein